jgi:hypothetical protein
MPARRNAVRPVGRPKGRNIGTPALVREMINMRLEGRTQDDIADELMVSRELVSYYTRNELATERERAAAELDAARTEGYRQLLSRQEHWPVRRFLLNPVSPIQIRLAIEYLQGLQREMRRGQV